MESTNRAGHLAEKHDEAAQDWQAGRLGTHHDDWEEGDHGGFCWKTLVVCIAIVVVAFLVARGLS